MTRESQLCTSRHTDGDSAPSEYNLGEDQAENVDGFNSDYCDLPRIRRRQKCHKKFSCALEAHLPAAARSLSSKKTATDRPNLMLQATTMLTTKKQTVVGRPAPEHRSPPHPPHNLKPKETTTPQQKTTKRRRRRRRRAAAAALSGSKFLRKRESTTTILRWKFYSQTQTTTTTLRSSSSETDLYKKFRPSQTRRGGRGWFSPPCTYLPTYLPIFYLPTYLPTTFYLDLPFSFSF